MRIVRENDQTDTEAGILTLEDDNGRRKLYVRRNRNAPLPNTPDLVQIGAKPAEFAIGCMLNTKNLPDRVTVGLTAGQPVEQHGAISLTADYVAAHEYEANERAFYIWELSRDKTMRERGPLIPLEVKQLLDITYPQQTSIWTVREVEAELLKWLQDKGEA